MPENLKITTISDTEFAKLAKRLAPVKVPLEQSPLWGNFDNHVTGREFLGSFRFDDTEGKLIALGSATLYRQKGRDWIWFKHGPLFASMPNTEVIKQMCSVLKQQFKNMQGMRPVFIRLSSPTTVPPLTLPFEHTMYDETVVVELHKPEDEIIAGMSQSGRRSLRKALKNNTISVQEITKKRVEIFAEYCYPILKETGSRDGFGIHPLSLYTSLLESLPTHARLYTATIEDKVQAWAITTEYMNQAMYYYGGSSAKARETDAAYRLHWEIILAMKQRGNLTYDFMGIAGKHYTGLTNVTQFKVKFSKNIISVPITYDLPLQTVKYRLLALAIKAKRRLHV